MHQWPVGPHMKTLQSNKRSILHEEHLFIISNDTFHLDYCMKKLGRINYINIIFALGIWHLKHFDIE